MKSALHVLDENEEDETEEGGGKEEEMKKLGLDRKTITSVFV